MWLWGLGGGAGNKREREGGRKARRGKMEKEGREGGMENIWETEGRECKARKGGKRKGERQREREREQEEREKSAAKPSLVYTEEPDSLSLKS